jgi:hypothetical protein
VIGKVVQLQGTPLDGSVLPTGTVVDTATVYDPAYEVLTWYLLVQNFAGDLAVWKSSDVRVLA